MCHIDRKTNTAELFFSNETERNAVAEYIAANLVNFGLPARNKPSGFEHDNSTPSKPMYCLVFHTKKLSAWDQPTVVQSVLLKTKKEIFVKRFQKYDDKVVANAGTIYIWTDENSWTHTGRFYSFVHPQPEQRCGLILNKLNSITTDFRYMRMFIGNLLKGCQELDILEDLEKKVYPIMPVVASNKKTGEKSSWGYIYLKSVNDDVIKSLVNRKTRIQIANSRESYSFDYIKTTIELNEEKNKKKWSYGK